MLGLSPRAMPRSGTRSGVSKRYFLVEGIMLSSAEDLTLCGVLPFYPFPFLRFIFSFSYSASFLNLA